MKRTSAPSSWRVSMLTGEVFGGRCDYCNTVLSADVVCRAWYEEHKSHMSHVSAWVRIVSPKEYRDLEIKLPVELFVGPKRPSLENPLHLPGIVFKFSCTRCRIQGFPAGEREVLAFRSRHGRHIEAVRLYAVIQNFRGRAVQQRIQVRGQQEPRSLNVIEATTPPAFALGRAAQLSGLCKTLRCTLITMRCSVCKSGHLLKSQDDVEDELPRHEDHLNYAYIHLTVKEPDEHAGLEMEVPAHPFSLASLVAQRGLAIDCVLLELSRQHGGPTITPWNAADVASYIQALEGRRSQPRLLALVRGQGGRAFQCEFPVIHVHSPSRSFRLVSRLEESFLHPAMEDA